MTQTTLTQITFHPTNSYSTGPRQRLNTSPIDSTLVLLLRRNCSLLLLLSSAILFEACDGSLQSLDHAKVIKFEGTLSANGTGSLDRVELIVVGLTTHKGGDVVLAIEKNVRELLLHLIGTDEHDLGRQAAGHKGQEEVHNELYDGSDGGRCQHAKSIRVASDQSLEHVNHEGRVRRRGAVGIGQDDEVGAVLGHGPDAGVGEEDEGIDLCVDVGIPRLTIGPDPKDGLTLLGQAVPVDRAGVEGGRQGLGLGELLGLLDGRGGSFRSVGKLDQLLHIRGTGLLAPLHHVRQLFHGVLQRAANGGVLGVGLGCHTENVRIRQVGVVLRELAGQLGTDDRQLLLGDLEIARPVRLGDLLSLHGVLKLIFNVVVSVNHFLVDLLNLTLGEEVGIGIVRNRCLSVR
mmetsp:Transcript_14966/g.35726  ORF Transcript_14966/g.35726 Transcript_14966/m.35726 type:complete len:403 (+) Transcript_14966:225-1433(+)